MNQLRNYAAAVLGVAVSVSGASGATVFHQLASFESGVPAAFAPQSGAILTQESLGATDGSFSLGVQFPQRPPEVGQQDHVYVAIDAENNNYAKWEEAATLQATTDRRFAVAYDMFLDFNGTTVPPGSTLFASDFRYNQDPNPSATPPIPGFQSIGGEFSLATRYSPIPEVDQAINVVVPFATDPSLRAFVVNPGPGVGFYQLQLAHKFDPVALAGNAKVYYDNFRILEFEDPQETVLFSWETPDNPATGDVNEQLEGWGPGVSVTPTTPLANHSRSITTVGATAGSSAIQIGTPSGFGAPGFTWGSQVVYTQAAQVNSVASALDDGERIELDVTFTEAGNGTADFFSFFMHISDSRGNFFQSPAAQFNDIANLELGEERTVTIQFGLREFRAGLALMTDADLLGTTSLAIGIGTNEGSVQPVTFSVDRLRIFSDGAAAEETADFDDDGDVDGADFLTWQRGLGTTGTATLAQGDANDDGNVNAADLAIWRSQFGTPGAVEAVGAVPECSSLALALVGAAAGCRRLRFSRRRDA